MTLEEAKANVGKPFKWIDGGTGITGRFDTIRGVGEDGTVYGDFLAAHHNDCRFKQDQPDQLKRESCDTHS